MIVMTIEVKQMLIKSTVRQGLDQEKCSSEPGYDLEEMKSEIMEKCRQLYIELLREEQER